MQRESRTRILVGAVLTGVLAAVAGGIALQALSGGIRVRSLDPAVLAVALGILGSLVMLHRRGLRLGPVLVANGVAFGLGTLAAGALDYDAVHGMARPLADVAFAVVELTLVMNAAWTLFILWFPDGSFASSRWRRFFVVAAVATIALALASWLGGPRGQVNGFYAGTDVAHGVGGPFAGAWKPLGETVALTLLFPLVALASILQRGRHAGVVVRQQIRWLFAALAVDVVVQLASVPFVGRGGWPGTVASVVSLIATPLPVVAATAAILRYRLWDIELVVSRALVYGVLWVALSALLLVPGLAAGLLVGGRDALLAVAIALAVTILFQPARTRLDGIAQRLVYRHRAPPYVLLTAFWETLRTRDLDRLGAPLADAVREGLAVEWAGVWLYEGGAGRGTMRPLGVAGAAPFGGVAIPDAVVRQLRRSPGMVLAAAPPEPLLALWPKAPAAIVPLVAAEELVGLLACGDRRGDPLAARDFELLELVSRDCALRLRNLRLEADRRERLAQIEAQASALRLSRRRLVSAQDEERRRIERNLHDGVQQQLVALAVRLQQASRTGDPLLADLANEAEQAIFALQELARGIFPGVLVDQGIAAALRTQAARMPLSVRVEVDSAVAATRLDPELEAAFYFVALEALTNTQKHAPAASAAVSLRAEGDTVVLEVVDDGRGFDRRTRDGSGLQNMEDRVAAMGGSFSIDSRPGNGTRVRAAAPARTSAGGGLAQVDQHRGDPAVQLGLGGQV